MRTAKLTVFFGSLAFILFQQALAEDVDLEKIVVTASRVEESYSDTSRKVDIISAKNLEKSGAKDLSEALTTLTSVNISDNAGLGAQKNIRMRGSTAAQVLVMVDGRPVNNPRDGQVDLSTIPLDNIERVEVMHGPGSSLYGSSAMGGTVNIITKNPPKEGSKTEIYSGFGTFRAYTERMSQGARFGSFGYIASGEYTSSEGHRDNSEFNAKDFNAKFKYEVNDSNLLTLSSGFFLGKLGTPGGASSPDIDDKQRNLKHFWDLNWDFKPDSGPSVSTKLYRNYDRLEFIENSAGSAFDTALSKFIHTTKVGGANLQLCNKFSERYRAIAGLNYADNSNDSTSTAKHKYIVRAAYAENQLNLSENLELDFSARLDDYSNFGSEFNPSFAFLYKINPMYKLRGLTSRSFRAPTFNDLYWPDEGWAKGNPNLKPEKGVTTEIGFDITPNKGFDSSITYYRSYFDNLINWAEEAGVWMPSNVDSALIQGVEFENRVNLSDEFKLGLNYTYLRAKDDETGKYLVYQPKHKIDFSLKYKFPKELLIEFMSQFTDKRYHDADNTIKVKRFYLFGFNVSKKFKKGVTCFLSVNNLLAKKYEVIRDFPMPEFSVNSGLKVEF